MTLIRVENKKDKASISKGASQECNYLCYKWNGKMIKREIWDEEQINAKPK